MVDFWKMEIFSRWMESIWPELSLSEKMKALELLQQIWPWTEEEIRIFSSLLVQEGKILTHTHWLVDFLARQEKPAAADGLYGWYLLRGMQPEDSQIVQSSFHEVPWLLKAEEGWLSTGDKEGFDLLQGKKISEWLDYLEKHDCLLENLRRFLWFTGFLDEEQSCIVAGRFSALAEDIRLSGILRKVRGTSFSENWLEEIRQTISQENPIAESEIYNFLDTRISRLQPSLSEIQLFFQDFSSRITATNDPLLNVCRFFQNFGKFLESPVEYKENFKKQYGRLDFSWDKAGFLISACLDIYTWAVSRSNTEDRHIAERSLYYGILLYKKLAGKFSLEKCLDICYERLTRLPSFELEIKLEFGQPLKADQFQCFLKGTLEAQGIGRWNPQKNIEEIHLWHKILGYLYENGQNEFSILIYKTLEEFLGELVFVNLSGRDHSALKTMKDLSEKLNSTTENPTKLITTFRDILNGYVECGGNRKFLNQVSLIFSGDQTIIDSPLDLMYLGGRPLSTEVNLAKSVHNIQPNSGFALPVSPQILFLGIEQGGEFRGYDFPKIPVKPLDAIAQKLQEVWGVANVSRWSSPQNIRLENGLQYEMDKESFDIVHIVGHGYKNETGENPYGIVLSNSRGQLQFAAGNHLIPWIKTIRPQLLVLSCCFSGANLPGNLFCQGLLHELLGTGVSCLVGFRWSISLTTAVKFANHFHTFLKQSRNPLQAMRETRDALYPGNPQNCDWAAPVLIYQG